MTPAVPFDDLPFAFITSERWAWDDRSIGSARPNHVDPLSLWYCNSRHRLPPVNEMPEPQLERRQPVKQPAAIGGARLVLVPIETNPAFGHDLALEQRG